MPLLIKEAPIGRVSGGSITPSLSGRTLDTVLCLYDNAPISFCGSDLRIILEVAQKGQAPALTPRLAKQVLEATTLSVATHRATAPVRSLGYINPTDFVLGTRTIAGSLVVTQFTASVLMRFLLALER